MQRLVPFGTEEFWCRGAKRVRAEHQTRREAIHGDAAEILLFEEAGIADPAGRYLLYPDAQTAI